jgi:hypothetical protein
MSNPAPAAVIPARHFVIPAKAGNPLNFQTLDPTESRAPALAGVTEFAGPLTACGEGMMQWRMEAKDRGRKR